MKTMGIQLLGILLGCTYVSATAAQADYDIVACDRCSDWDMQQKAESVSELKMSKVHVFNAQSGQLNAYFVIHDFDSRQDFSTQVPPDTLVQKRASAYTGIKATLKQATIPTSIVSSPWQLASYDAAQAQLTQWLLNDASFVAQATESLQAKQVLMGDIHTHTQLAVRFADQGTAVFRVSGAEGADKEWALSLALETAHDGFGNVIPQDKTGLEGEFIVAGGQHGNALFIQEAAQKAFGLGNIAFDSLPASGSTSSFNCTISTDNALLCVSS